jgi:hypothetical protein
VQRHPIVCLVINQTRAEKITGLKPNHSEWLVQWFLADTPEWNADEEQIADLVDFLAAHGEALEEVSISWPLVVYLQPSGCVPSILLHYVCFTFLDKTLMSKFFLYLMAYCLQGRCGVSLLSSISRS